MNEIKIEPETGIKTIPHEIRKKIIEAGWNIEDSKIFSPKYEHVTIKKVETEHQIVKHQNMIEYLIKDIPLIELYLMQNYCDKKDEVVHTPAEINETRDMLISKIEKLTEIAKDNNMMIKGNPDKVTIYNKDKRTLIDVDGHTKIQRKSERDTWVLAKNLYGRYLYNNIHNHENYLHASIRQTEAERTKYEKELVTELQAIKPVKLLTKDVLPKPRQFVDISYNDINASLRHCINHEGRIWQVHVQKISHLKDDCVFNDAINDPNCTDLWFICSISCHYQYNQNFKIAYRPSTEGWHMLYRTGRDRITTEISSDLNKYDEMLIKKAIDLYKPKEG